MDIYAYTPLCMAVLVVVFYILGVRRAENIAVQCGGTKKLHSLVSHYGMFSALSCTLPAVFITVLWKIFENTVISSSVSHNLPREYLLLSADELSLIINEVKNAALSSFTTNSTDPAILAAANQYLASLHLARNIVCGTALFSGIAAALFTLKKIHKDLRARNIVEGIVTIALICCSGVAILTTIGIVLSVLFEALHFFKAVPVSDFLFGLQWSPQMAIRADQAGSSGAFGIVPVFLGTFLIAAIAMSVAIPIGLLSAIYLSEYANNRIRTIVKPVLEILAGIPTVVYGFFAALTVAPLIRNIGNTFAYSISSESALAAGLVMGIMIIPFVSSLSDDVIHAVPQVMRDGSLALGATHFETIRHVIIPAALPGIVASILLAVSRALGETMIVVMAAGLSANLTFNPLSAVTTVTVQIVTLLVGDQEFDSPKTLAAFALGLLLFIFTLILNIIALKIVRKYREQYE